MTAPRYQDIAAKDVPIIADDDGTAVRVVCGEFWGKRGPVEGVAARSALSRRLGAGRQFANRCRSRPIGMRLPMCSRDQAVSARHRSRSAC